MNISNANHIEPKTIAVDLTARALYLLTEALTIVWYDDADDREDADELYTDLHTYLDSLTGVTDERL